MSKDTADALWRVLRHCLDLFVSVMPTAARGSATAYGMGGAEIIGKACCMPELNAATDGPMAERKSEAIAQVLIL